MKGKDPGLSPFSFVVYYYCLFLKPRGDRTVSAGGKKRKRERWICLLGVTSAGSDRKPSYLHHGHHAVVGDRVGADGEVARRVSADDPVDSVPVGRVRLVGVNHCQVGHHHVHSVLWHLTGKLKKENYRMRLELQQMIIILDNYFLD